MAAAVDVALEGATLLSELAYACQRENLETSAVGEYGAVPGNEFVQSSRRTQDVKPRPKVEMIGVAQNDLRPYILFQVSVVHALDGTYGAHGHKDGGFYLAVVSCQHSASCRTVLICFYKFECHPQHNYVAKVSKIP